MKTKRDRGWRGVWVFGDYRNYFQNRVTLQLIAKGNQLARELGTDLTVLILGSEIHQYAMEYTAHGADVVMVVDHPGLKNYQVETYVRVVSQLVQSFKPEIFLAGATAFGGELLADIITPEHRPQMATVHPGVFEEKIHDEDATARILHPEVDIEAEERVQLVRSRPEQSRKGDLEEADVVIVGGKGLGSKEHFQRLFELAHLLGGEVGATRPVILSGWTEESRLLGQTGKNVKPKLLITAGTSGAVQYTTGIQGAETIIAINRDPHAPIFKMADLGLVGDARAVLSLLLEKLRKRL